MTRDVAVELFKTISDVRTFNDENVYETSIIARRQAMRGNGAVDYLITVELGPGGCLANWRALFAAMQEWGDELITLQPTAIGVTLS